MKNKLYNLEKYTIIGLILWLVIDIVLIAPLAVAITEAKANPTVNLIECFIEEVTTFTSFTRVFNGNTLGTFIKGILVAFVFAVFLVYKALSKDKPFNEFKNIEHGSSGWCKDGEQYRILNKKEGIILAEDNYLPVDKMGNINVLVMGGSGAGKSTCYSIPNAHQLLGSYVFTDPKGELYDRTAGYLKENGYEIKILNLVNAENSDGYNPLFHIESEIDVDVIAHTIIKGQETEGGSKDPFWDDNAESLLKSLIYYLIATRPLEEQNLASCAELVRTASNSSSGSNMLSSLMKELPYGHPARTFYGNVEVSAQSEKTYSSILSTLQSKLGKFDSKEIANITSTNTINFEDIATRKTALYVVSSDTHTAYNFLLTIFFAQMIQHLYDFADKSGGKLPIQTFFILDEFANIGQIPDFDKKISTSRSRNIQFSVILQNLDQLKAVYEKSYETIIGNCDTHVFLGSNSAVTCEYFSKQLGEKTITHDNVSTNRDKKHHKQGYSQSDQIMARALMTPDELRRMDNNDCIIFEKGIRPIKAKKYWYFRRPMAKEMADVEINHNDFDAGVRGEWRKFNPYNPYKPETEQTKTPDLRVESLDDLFEETDSDKDNKSPNIENIENTENKPSKFIPEPIKTQPVPAKEVTDEEEYEIDLQKQLEAKFDELFGPLDDDK